MKGILFTEILFNKTIRKEKTMTRREHGLKVINNHQSDFIGFYHPVEEYFYASNGKGIDLKIAPTYKVGEVVYIKEPYHEDELGIIRYKYDFPEDNEWRNKTKFKNKLFVGAKYGRNFIRITSIKCERLYDISDDDCLKEGIESQERFLEDTMYWSYLSKEWFFDSPQQSFFSLFRFANRVPKSKEIPNSWVFCYSYCLCDINGNEL